MHLALHSKQIPVNCYPFNTYVCMYKNTHPVLLLFLTPCEAVSASDGNMMVTLP